MLIKATSADFEFIYGLYFHPDLNPFLLYEPMEAADFAPIFEELIKTEVLYCFEHQGEKVGMCKLIPLRYRNNHIAYLGGVAIHPNFAGKGFGEQMIREILSRAKHMGFLRVELSTATINERAIRLYEKTGFQKEGILRKFSHLKNQNRFLDEVMMSCLFD